MALTYLATLRKQEYSLRHVVSHMQYWREGSNWIIQEGGRSNTAFLALLGIGADYVDVNTHEIIASACPGDIVLTPQGVRYEFHVRSAQKSIANISNLPNGCFYWDGVKHDAAAKEQVANAVFLGFEMFDEMGESTTIGAKIEVLRFKEVHELFRQLGRYASDCEFSPAIIKAKALEFITHLSEIAFSKKPRSSAYRRIEPSLQHIASQPMGSLTVKGLADACEISSSCFRMLFKKEMGITPHEYIQKKRLQRAISLLTTSDLLISEIASETGFQDAFYFSRIFKKATGVSPSRWRESYR